VELLTMEGHELTLCYDGAEALRCFCENPNLFDVVLTDQEMPKMSGLQLTKKLLEIQPELPVVLATGLSLEVSEENYRDFGLQRFLAKPLNYDQLFQVLQEVTA